MRRAHHLLLTTALVVVAAACGGEAGDQPAVASPAIDRFAHSIGPHSFQTAAGALVQAEWGVLTVPEHRARPDSNLMEVPFVRFKSNASNPGTPVVYLSDRPGDEPGPLAPANLALLFQVTEPLRASADLIVMAQRGGADSRPDLACPGRSQSLPVTQPLDLETEVTAAVVHAQACIQFWETQDVAVSGYNAQEMAADVETLRRALGYEKISLWGVGFGSHQALAVLRHYGEHVERAVLTQVEGPDQTFQLPGDYQRVLEELDRRVQADPQLSRRIPDLLALGSTVLDRLTTQPASVEVVDPATGRPVAVIVGRYDLARVTLAGLGSAAFLAELPARYTAMAQGDYSWLGAQSLRLRSASETHLLKIVPNCASGMSLERRARIDPEAATSLVGDAAKVAILFCDRLGRPDLDLGEAFRAPLRSDVPTLLISGSLDSGSPASDAEEVLQGLPNGQHLVIDGAAHDATPTAALGPAMQFLRGDQVTAERITVPFDLVPAAE